MEGEAGLLAINGQADQPPLKSGVAVVDMFTGIHSAQAMLAAWFQRQQSGAGRQAEMASFDCGPKISAYSEWRRPTGLLASACRCVGPHRNWVNPTNRCYQACWT